MKLWDGAKKQDLDVLLYTLLFLVFLQLLTDFVEAIYVFGLLGTSIPVEIASVLLFLSPLILLLLPRGLSGWPMVAVGELMLLCRVVEAGLDPRGKMLVSGLGVACFLLFLPSLLAQHEEDEGEAKGVRLGAGLAAALSLSILLRAFGSGSDISTAGRSQVIGWVLAAGAGALLVWRQSEVRLAVEGCNAPATRDRLPLGKTVALSLGIAGALVLCYFAFSSPAVVARWTGFSYPAIVTVAATTVCLFAMVVGAKPGLLAGLSRRTVVLWNVAFGLCLVLTIAGHQVRFPSDPTAYPLAPNPAAHWLYQVPLYLMLLLHPVVLVNLMLLCQELVTGHPRPRAVGAGFSLAGLYLLLIVFAQVFTTVYDYIPVAGPLFRDRFWLVFLAAWAVMALPVLLVGQRASETIRAARGWQAGRALFVGVALATVGSVAGVAVTAARPVTAPQSATSLKILTYNIQQGYDRYGRKNYEGQLDLIRRVDADIVGLQECDTTRIANGNSDVVRYIADELDLYSAYGPKTVAGTFGIALLAKYPIENPRVFYMYSEGEQTATIEAQIRVGGKRFTVFVTHLGNGGPIVQQQAILAEVEGKENVILLGDFNFRPDTEQYRLTAAMLDNSWVVKWPGGNDRQGVELARAIDHIFVSPGTRVADSTYLPGPDSDHPALTSTIEW
ncbi:MAG TPA: endonuclease/exonuclease/phosphatase family protein [Anaerolineae bacterium]|nr:endonuclease/exonuclease/phosphatase family protein [Anaerolineae bacterium]